MQLFEQFIQERVYLKNVTPSTVRWYRCSLRAFASALSGGAPLKESLKQAVVDLRQRGVSAVAVNTYCRCINAYLRWLHQEGHSTELLRLPRLQEEKKVLETFTGDQIWRVFDFKPRKLSEHRTRTLFCLLIDTGLRISEALNLDKDDIDMDNLLLRVREGKGRKGRVVPMSLELRRILYRWLQKFSFPAVFCTRNGTRITKRNAHRDLAILASKLGIVGVRTSAHTCRHTFATGYLRNGGDIYRLSRILGHASVKTTEKYLHLQTADLQAVHQRLSLLGQVR